MALTKIVVTVGPAVEKISSLVKLMKAGADVFRFNLKHGSYNWHSACIKRVERASRIAGKPVAILLDLQGPEIRVGKLTKEWIRIKKGDRALFVKEDNLRSFPEAIPVSESFFQEKLIKGKKFFIDEGRLEFKILNIDKNNLHIG